MHSIEIRSPARELRAGTWGGGGGGGGVAQVESVPWPDAHW